MSQDHAAGNPWQSTGYRDENARLLVRAISRHRAALLELHPFVPVQGYGIRADEPGPRGGLPVGTLITLWERSPVMEGTCPGCDGPARPFGIGGGKQWFVLAPCEWCGTLSFRTFALEELCAALASGLEGSPFDVPSPQQLLGGNAIPHTALLEVLRGLGTNALPPDHYGFVGGNPEFLCAMINPVVAQSFVWYHRSTVRHAPSGAWVGHAEGVCRLVAQLTEAHLERTGRLPELDFDLPDNLRVTFPLISQELLTPETDRDDDGCGMDAAAPGTEPFEAADADRVNEDNLADDGDAGLEGNADGVAGAVADRRDDGTDDPGDDGRDFFQGAADRLIASWKAGALDEEALQDVLAWPQASAHDDDLGEWLCSDAIAVFFSMTGVATVRAHCGLGAGSRVTVAHRMRFLGERIFPEVFEERIATHSVTSFWVRASNGDSAVLAATCCLLEGDVVPLVTWYGPVETPEAFVGLLRAAGWVSSPAELLALPSRMQRAIVDRTLPDLGHLRLHQGEVTS